MFSYRRSGNVLNTVPRYLTVFVTRIAFAKVTTQESRDYGTIHTVALNYTYGLQNATVLTAGTKEARKEKF